MHIVDDAHDKDATRNDIHKRIESYVQAVRSGYINALEAMCINQQDLDGGIDPSTSITITEALGRIASAGDTDLTKYRALVRFLPAPLVLALKGSYA